MRRTLTAAAGVLILAGCASPTVDYRQQTESNTTQTAPQSQTADDDQVMDIAFELAWQDMNNEQRSNICWGWDNMEHDWTIDQIQDSMPDASREQIIEFFEDKC